MNASHVKIGAVVSKHGYKGQVKINVSSFNLNSFKKAKHFFIDIDGCFIPFKIEKLKSFSKSILIVDFKEVDSVEQAERIIHKNVYVDFKPKSSSKESDFFYNDLINYSVYRDSLNIGTIESINTQLPQPVFEVMHKTNKVLIPIHEDLIKKIDKERNIIHLDFPDGLLEII